MKDHLGGGFTNWIEPIRGRDGDKVRVRIKGKTENLENPIKAKHIDPKDLARLGIFFKKAFNDEFGGTEGMVAESKLTKGIEDPDEIARRTVASLAGKGFSASEIADNMLRVNRRVRQAIAPETQEWFDRQISLEAVIREFWPSAKK